MLAGYVLAIRCLRPIWGFFLPPFPFPCRYGNTGAKHVGSGRIKYDTVGGVGSGGYEYPGSVHQIPPQIPPAVAAAGAGGGGAAMPAGYGNTGAKHAGSGRIVYDSAAHGMHDSSADVAGPEMTRDDGYAPLGPADPRYGSADPPLKGGCVRQPGNS